MTRDDFTEECEIMEIDGTPNGEMIGVCVDGRPVYRSHFAGTIYHAGGPR